MVHMGTIICILRKYGLEKHNQINVAEVNLIAHVYT